MNRRLAAILSADVVGYTRLMRENEEAVLEGIKSVRKLVIEPALSSRGGRIVKLMGDGLLAEFPSALEAVRTSLDIQKKLAEEPSPAGITYRIGINLGDVITENGDIFGDGVNLAARLEAAAPQGGICVAASVYDQVRDKVDMTFEDMGELELKNVDRPVRAFQWMPQTFVVTERKTTNLLDRPSIAVLAFTNMGADQELDFFGDGLAEEIITGLSKLAGLLVIARDSSFVYKGQSVDIREVGQELDVRYVLVGSVRASGTRIRVSAQLVDSEQGGHIWADRYDRILDDIFEIQDEITQCVCAAIEGALSLEEKRRAQLRRPESLDAWSAYHLGLAAHEVAQQTDNPVDKLDAERKAISHFERATTLDPRFARPFAARALILRSLVIQNVLRGDEAQSAIDEALRFCREAMALGPQDSAPHVTRGILLGMKGDWAGALRSIENGISLNPNSAIGFYERGQVKALGLDPEGAIDDFETGARLSPLDPRMLFRYPLGSWALMRLGRYSEAAEWGEIGVQEIRSVMFPAIDAAAAHTALGNHRRAEDLVAEALRRQPDLTVENLRQNLSYASDEDFKEWFFECLVQSGLPIK